MGRVTPLRGAKGRRTGGDQPASAPPSAPSPAPQIDVLQRARQRELEAAWRRVHMLEVRVEELEKDRLAHIAQFQALTASTSWRLTAPLRWLLERLRPSRTAADSAAKEAAAPPARLAARGLTGRPPGRLTLPEPHDLACLPELSGQAIAPLPNRVSVVIPTLNAGDEFHWLLRRLLGQKGLGAVEVVIVDSGSTDGTPELAERLGCRIVRIPKAEFTHSHARNLGADAASGDLLLFMVQDAYPVGEHWLHALASALVRPRSEAQRVSALSCSEFARRDSELLYNLGIEIHYGFLGCRDADRIGTFLGDDHMALRTQGQLSDVACLIPAATFQQYRYEGRYAEDLMLGVRMLRDGHRLALLSSVKVIHSHNRPAAYHLKRAFVDVFFLAGSFPDFEAPRVESAAGGLAAAAGLAAIIEAWKPIGEQPAGDDLFRLADRARRLTPQEWGDPAALDFGVAGLGDWIAAAVAAEGPAARGDALVMTQMFSERMSALADHVTGVYGVTDLHLANALKEAAWKSLAACVGAQLCFLHLCRAPDAGPDLAARLDALRDLLAAGV